MSWLNWQYQVDIISGEPLLKWESKRKGMGWSMSIHFESTWCTNSCWMLSRTHARVVVCDSYNLLCHFKQVRRREKKVFLQENCSRRRIYTKHSNTLAQYFTGCVKHATSCQMLIFHRWPLLINIYKCVWLCVNRHVNTEQIHIVTVCVRCAREWAPVGMMVYFFDIQTTTTNFTILRRI